MRSEETWEIGEGIDLAKLWNIVNRRKWAILGLAFAVGLLAALFTYSLTPIYQASATLLIESQEANVVSIEEVYGLDTRSQTYLETQFEILRSWPLGERVVASLALHEHPQFTPVETEPAVELNWRSWLPFSLPAQLSQSIQAEPDPRESALRRYMANLAIVPIEGTQLVNVRFESPFPELAATIATEHAEEFIQSMLDARVDVTSVAATWMAERLEGMQDALHAAEERLQEFREREQLVDVDGLRALPSQAITDLSSRLLEVRQTLSSAEIAYLQVTRAGNSIDELLGVPAVLSDPGIRDVMGNQAAAEQVVAELEKRYGPLHPRMIAAQSELAQTTENLVRLARSVTDGITNTYEAARAEEAAILAALEGAQEDYQDIGRKESELNALQRAVETNRQLYELFYNRLSETSATGDLAAAQARVIAPAVIPTAPVRPNKARIVILAVVMTLLFGVGIAFLLDTLDNTLKSAADVAEKLGYPLLGMVPLLKHSSKSKTPKLFGSMFSEKADSVFNEAIRTIRTSISLDNLDQPHKIILVTSAIGSEGKSTIALNLAHAFSEVENVLIIDSDMRRPTVGKQLGLPRDRRGLSELLAKKARLPECIWSGESQSLDVLMTGFIPPNPLELLSSTNLSVALNELRGLYDRIIIDSPPILPVSDSLVLSTHSDAIVVVAKADATPVKQVTQALDLLERTNAPITGIVLSQLDIQKAEKYRDYGYGGYYEAYESGSG